MERRLSAILAADVVGYSRLMGIDESGTLQALNRHRCELVDVRISDYKGRIVKLTGDGILAEFQSVVNAVACAAEIQRSMAARNENVPQDERVEFRIGINLGDVVVENGDIFGDGVNLAARLERIAAPGGIAVSASVRDQVGSRLNLGFDFIGEHMLKNIRQPVQVYTVSLTPPSSAKLVAQNRNTCFIAVLPFTNMSGDADQDYFSDGITEDIITDLSKISSLHVVPRNTIFTYKGISVKVKRLAQELGVRYVLEGSVRIFGNRVRISGQLIDTANGDHLWAERYDRDLTDIFAIQDEITHAIVGQLKVRLLPEEKKAIANEPTANVEAYTYYLRGRQLSHTWTKSYLQLARRMFCKAVELDPDYARAYAGIADCDAAIRDWAPDDVPLRRILDMSARALALDPDLPEAHASHGLALHQSGYDDRAAAAFERALALDPNLFEANFHYARFFFMHGNFAESVQYFTRAAAIRPDDYVSPIHLMSAYRSLGRVLDTENWARLGLLRAERALNLNPENSGPAHRGALALAHMGDVSRARDWAARAIAIDPDDIVAQYNLACVYSVLGDADQAIDLLERLLPHSSVYHIKWFNNDSDLDNIRDDPRFQRLLAAAMMQRERIERTGS
ncbi:adenylate/guanylate cyclase domain-containing protein [Rhizobium hidalgonense]|uniref:Adenylate/guanylate cyclase domain-containing protein n=1 Tax=Rhizobium hidalgonense TaxID=1538159 RepID=A0A2A6KJU1_9HYPH|nr:adenylate/guanylate cyclase domain-containing protein [Rhizobium hidalgonense]MDR9775858.1 adenylate/guanylate cyclase domain-containing protein [Rhizobium hidalgonense]MDR9805967.1 adenylate/guanylate cyclase domain-containing protein [Rhizobium hidalgonense]MDR9811715.1 adenylate/guanylate cyclase domain-containing protein [Rhizobium hidalgonense]MDR9820049.1 adenylate/guanylate cyclase domain-containing protein [Rhizobium hidalgonense]PDT24672.1 adenylate/guanylate cyclase domain-contain